MRRVTLFFVAIVMLGLITTPILAESDSQETDVEVNLEGCWIELDTSSSYLISPAAGTAYTNWSPGDILGGDSLQPQDIKVTTSCKGYDLSVKATNFSTPNKHKSEWYSETPYKDFELRAEVTSGGTGSQIPNYKAFDSLDTDETILSTSNPKTSHVDIYYRYRVDSYDVAGEYIMHLTYTASSN